MHPFSLFRCWLKTKMRYVCEIMRKLLLLCDTWTPLIFRGIFSITFWFLNFICAKYQHAAAIPVLLFSWHNTKTPKFSVAQKITLRSMLLLIFPALVDTIQLGL
jgi:hypothetical protein